MLNMNGFSTSNVHIPHPCPLALPSSLSVKLKMKEFACVCFFRIGKRDPSYYYMFNHACDYLLTVWSCNKVTIYYYISLNVIYLDSDDHSIDMIDLIKTYV